MDTSGGWSSRQREAGRQTADGFVPTHELERLKPTRWTFTHVRFWPDWEIFDDGAAFDYAATCERVRLTCHLVAGLRIAVTDRRRGATAETFDFRSEKGLAGLVGDLAGAGTGTVTRVIDIAGGGSFEEKVPLDGRLTTVERDCTVTAALQWTDGYRTDVRSFVNTIPTPAGGTHLAGFERALTRAVNDVLLDGSKRLARTGDRGRAGGGAGGARRRIAGRPARAAVPGPDQAGVGYAGGAVNRL